MLQKSCSQGVGDSERAVNKLLDKGDFKGALAMATRMRNAGMTEVEFELGTIHERGGPGVPIDIRKAIGHYRQAAHSIPCDITAIYLSRALRKNGEFESSKQWLLEAEKYGRTARIELGWALFLEQLPDGDLEQARRHYLRAAMRGRFFGFGGYARVSRRLGQHGRALLADVLRVSFGPFIALAIGRKARENF